MAATNSQRIVRGYGLYERLREHKPTKVIAYDAEGDETTVNVPDVRQRHARVMEALKEVAWTRADLLDKRGGLLYRHQRNSDDQSPASELEDLQPMPRVAELGALVTIMLRAQEVVLTQTQRQMQGVFEAQNRILDAMLKRFELQERQHAEVMELNHALSADLVAAQLAQLQASGGANLDEDGKPQSDRALQALLPQMLRMMLGGAAGKDTAQAGEPRRGKRRAGAANTNGATSAHANGASGPGAAAAPPPAG